jgi:hypothetical protein
MVQLANEANRQLLATITADGKPYRICASLFRKARTAGGVPKIAKLAHFFEGGRRSFVSWGTAVTLPAGAERKSCRMKPGSIVALCSWHEEWAGHKDRRRCGHCTERLNR